MGEKCSYRSSMMNFTDLNVIKSMYENNSLEKANVIIKRKRL